MAASLEKLWRSSTAGSLKDESLFYFAGLWEVWRDLHAREIRTVTLITTEPNAVTQPVHDRMPVILRRENQAKWLSSETPVEELRSLLVPYPTEELKATPVSTAVNGAKYDGPELVAPLALAGEFRLEG